MKFTDKTTINGSPGEIDDNGFLRLRKVRLGRAGIQQYLGKELPAHLGFEDNEVVNVYRPPEEVFADDSLASLEGVPVEVEHEWKTPGNNSSVGSFSGVPVRDGNDILGKLLITGQSAIKPIQDRKLSDISLGYQADISKEDGFFDGKPYQAVQRKIRYNHVAILRPGGGRAGKNIRIEDKNMPDNLITVDSPHGEIQVSPDSKPALKKVLDACAAGEREREKMQDSNEELAAKVKDYDAVKAELEDAKKKNDKMEGELKAKEKELEDAEDPEKLEKKAKELNDAQTIGKAIMGDKMPKGLGATALRLEIAKHYARENGIVGDSEERSNDFYDGIYTVAAKSAEKVAPPKKVPGAEMFTDHKISDARQKYVDSTTGKEDKK